MADSNVRTYRDSKLVDLFVSYVIYRKENGSHNISETEIEMCFWNAIGGIDETYRSDEFIMSMRDDFELFYKVLDKISNRRGREIRSMEGVRDKYSDTEIYLTPPQISARWKISGSAIRRAIIEKRLKAKGQEGRKCKYLILKEDFENYAKNNGIPLRC